jgi:hypothetical protein
MELEQRWWTPNGGWQATGPRLGERASLALIFAGTGVLEGDAWISEVAACWPNAQLFGCSTAGEICGTRVFDDSLVVTALSFSDTRVSTAYVDLGSAGADSQAAGATLARTLPHDGLTHVFTLSDGRSVNGSELVRGMLEALPAGVQVTGGLAGDGARFAKTLVFADGVPRENAVAAIGFYGDGLRVGYGSLGGWDAFGPERIITRSAGNVLYELDRKPALELYKSYLGDQAAGLPATGLLFPLNIRRKHGDQALVRTILAVDEEQQSLTFAGDVPEGARAQLMKANFERLIEGAEGAAKNSQSGIVGTDAQLAVLISCVGRKLVLKQRTEEEVESVRDVLGAGAVLTGFYSYGEICPAAPDASCELHNQTMTITTFSEGR